MIRVLKSGFYTSVQDKGRFGFASLGIPTSGVMDRYTADLANRILNNTSGAAVLEITFSNCKFQFLTQTSICISGGHFSPSINDKAVSLNSMIDVKKEDVLSFGNINFGARCYVAVKGGFLSNKVLGSRSFYKNITSQILLKKGDLLPIQTFKNEATSSNTSIKVPTSHFKSQVIECYEGPEYGLLNEIQKRTLWKQLFTISKNNNRMGFQLEENIINTFPSILTSGVLPGTVQLTPSGKLIVLMRDCQVTGGYPRILQLSEIAINILAQKTTKNQIKFVLKRG